MTVKGRPGAQADTRRRLAPIVADALGERFGRRAQPYADLVGLANYRVDFPPGMFVYVPPIEFGSVVGVPKTGSGAAVEYMRAAALALRTFGVSGREYYLHYGGTFGDPELDALAHTFADSFLRGDDAEELDVAPDARGARDTSGGALEHSARPAGPSTPSSMDVALVVADALGERFGRQTQPYADLVGLLTRRSDLPQDSFVYLPPRQRYAVLGVPRDARAEAVDSMRATALALLTFGVTGWPFYLHEGGSFGDPGLDEFAHAFREVYLRGSAARLGPPS